jgi:hypothetical protein
MVDYTLYAQDSETLEVGLSAEDFISEGENVADIRNTEAIS